MDDDLLVRAILLAVDRCDGDGVFSVEAFRMELAMFVGSIDTRVVGVLLSDRSDVVLIGDGNYKFVRKP